MAKKVGIVGLGIMGGAFAENLVQAGWRVVGFHEKAPAPPRIPGDPGRCLASMGNYVFGRQVLDEMLMRDAADRSSSHDFGRDILPRMVAEGRPVWSADLLADPRVPVAAWLRERLEHEGLRTVAAAPLRVAGVVRGALGLLDGAGRTVDDQALARLAQTAEEVGRAIGHAMATETLRIRLDAQAAILQGLGVGAAAGDLDARPACGEWSAREHLAHLARHQVVFLERIVRIPLEEAPVLGRYRAEDDEAWPAWSTLPLDEVLARHRAARDRLREWLTALSADEARGVVFVRPELVTEVEFRAWTAEGLVRHASFRGLREDRSPEDVVRESGGAVQDKPRPAVRLTHPDRLYWKDEGVTKQGLADYYSEVGRGWGPTW